MESPAFVSAWLAYAYGASGDRTRAMAELEDLKNRYLSRLTLHMVFSQEATDLPLYNGRLDRAKIGLVSSELGGDAGHVYFADMHEVDRVIGNDDKMRGEAWRAARHAFDIGELVTWLSATRSWAIESRSRTVTASCTSGPTW